jgi:hypothetical protein
MPPDVDFDSAPAVEGFVRERFAALYPGCSDRWLRRVFADVEDLFEGRNPAYLAADLRYHNLRHTLMATTCMAVLLEGMNCAHGDQRIEVRDFELGIAGVLMHDSGYMKLRSDTEGTGAKYTFCHILRSCAFAASYLPQVGVSEIEVENVMSAINCTGPNAEISRLRFRDPVSRIVGCALATADYVGQLADPIYPDKLGELYGEFHESDLFANIPPERRLFRSEEELVAKTPAFWHSFVKPKLDNDFQAVYRFLERPPGSGRNDYMDAIESNFATIEARIAARAAAT